MTTKKTKREKTSAMDERQQAERERRWRCESALLVLVATQLKAEAARILVGSPQQGEDSFVAQARSAWRQAVAETDAQVERFRNLSVTAKGDSK